MGYTQESLLAEIMNRSRRIRARREQMRMAALTAAALSVTVLFAGAWHSFAGVAAEGNPGTVYGSFLLPGAAGGFVLAAVIAFAAGVTVTLICIGRRNRSSGRSQETEEGVGHEEEKE
ncbi:MAG: hypothetical protein K6E50_02205 [Lachnospiraceae bacterium]|nr:hypothetical protein [Lachnospiraceae bacterium]